MATHVQALLILELSMGLLASSLQLRTAVASLSFKKGSALEVDVSQSTVVL